MNSRHLSPLGKVPDGWSLVQLKDLAEKVKSGATPKGGESNYLSRREHFALIRSQNVYDRHFDETGLAFISDHQAAELTGAEVQAGDVLLNITGDGITFARSALVPDRVLPACVNQHVMLIRPLRRKCDSGFLLSYLTHPCVKDYIESFNAGGSRRAITKAHIESFEIPIPPLRDQQVIAQILGRLDDKIEVNRRMNKTLEALARSLFKSWFVDPIQAALPKGWREGKVSDLARLSRDALNPGGFPEETFDHYSIPAFDESRTPEPETGDAIKSNKFIVSPGCVLVSKLNPRIPRVWLPDLSGANRAICSTEFLVTSPKPGVSREFLFCLFTNESFASVFATMVTGTSGSHQRVQPEGLLCMDTVIPPQSLIQEFTAVTAPFLNRISHNITESRSLAALRDALLPKLVSGELRIASPLRP